MAGNDDLMLEVTGSSNKATSALDKVIAKITDLQSAFEKLSPSLTKFTEKMDSIASSSKSMATLKNLTESTNKQALSSKNAESKMAMYQARLDRASTSMSRSQIQSEKLAQALKKVSEAESIAAKNSVAFSMPASEFANKYNTGKGNKGINLTPELPNESYIPTPPGVTNIASNIGKAKSSTATVNVDTTQAQAALAQVQAFIDRLTPSISGMSAEAQAEFSALASKLTMVSQQIDNQRALYHNLASAATQAANTTGENSTAYLRLEKRMLSADSAIDRLIDKQEKLKSEMSGISATTGKASASMTDFGKKSEKAAKRGTSGLAKMRGMMEKMFIRIAAFRIFSALSQGITTGIQNIAQASKGANSSLSSLATSSLYLKNSIASALMPAIQALTPAITWLVDKIADLFNMIGMLTARLFGNATTVTVAKSAQVNYAKSVAKSNKAVKELQRSIMGFDEINRLSKEVSTSSGNNSGMPTAQQMFQTQKISDKIIKIADKLKKLQPFFNGLGKVISGFWNVIKNFTETYLYTWLVDIGNWMESHPNVMYNLGKGLGYVAVGLAAFKALKWLGEITGVTKLVKWLWGLHEATKAVNTAFGEKNKTLTEQTKDTSTETSAVKNLVPAFAGAAVAAAALAWGLSKVKMPALNPSLEPINVPALNLTAFSASKAVYQQTIAAPVIAAATAPALILVKFLQSKATYLSHIVAPAVAVAMAPALVLKYFLASKKTYQSTVTPPTIQKATAPAIDLQTSFFPSINTAKTAIETFVKDATLALTPLAALFGASASAKSTAAKSTAAKKAADKKFNNQKWDEASKGMQEFSKQHPVDTRKIAIGLSGGLLAGASSSSIAAWLAKFIPSFASGGIVSSPTLSLVGEGADSEAIIPLNQNVFSQIAQGIVKNGDSNNSGLDTDKIVSRLDSLESAIKGMKIVLQADDRKIAESANRGNKSIGRRYSTVAST